MPFHSRFTARRHPVHLHDSPQHSLSLALWNLNSHSPKSSMAWPSFHITNKPCSCGVLRYLNPKVNDASRQNAFHSFSWKTTSVCQDSLKWLLVVMFVAFSVFLNISNSGLHLLLIGTRSNVFLCKPVLCSSVWGTWLLREHQTALTSVYLLLLRV